ncbi:MAG: sensor histidine kinase [Desulfovibrionaceae bacterium]|nr:sensor histidine kinase [Desulfovibrionaceae bacterium]
MNCWPRQPDAQRPPGSLRLRLLAGTLAWIALAVALTGWGLRNHLFRDHITQQLQGRLVHELNQLSAAVNITAGGAVEVTPMVGDPALDEPLSGMYWQVDLLQARPGQAPVARSRSLWDQALDLSAPLRRQTAPTGGFDVLHLRDDQGHDLLAVTRILQLPEDDAPPLRLTVAADQALLAEPIRHFTRMLLLTLGVLACVLAVAVFIQLRLALGPFDLLRKRLVAVRQGTAARLEGRFPREVQPLVDELNHGLGVNADMVQRARTQAGNLAHAVNTPLSIMGNAAAGEDSPLARLVREQVGIAHRQVEHHLARARSAAASRATGLRTPVLPCIHALIRAMQRLHAERQVSFDLLEQAADEAFRGEEQDLYELLGNLIDNAGKWARSRVEIDVQREGAQLCISIDDDGPGIPAGQRERMFERGVQLDERRPGSGLGLDIVRELAQIYGGSVQPQSSPLGGLRMRLCLPAAR